MSGASVVLRVLCVSVVNKAPALLRVRLRAYDSIPRSGLDGTATSRRGMRPAR